LHLIIVVELQECGEKSIFHLQSQWSPEIHLLPVRSSWDTSARKLHREIVWRNAPRIWRDFGSAPPFQTRLTRTNPVLPLSNEHDWQVKDQGRRLYCHNKHKNFPICLHVMCLYFPDTPLTNHTVGDCCELSCKLPVVTRGSCNGIRLHNLVVEDTDIGWYFQIIISSSLLQGQGCDFWMHRNVLQRSVHFWLVTNRVQVMGACDCTHILSKLVLVLFGNIIRLFQQVV
jgi:hypothetical protein